MYSTGEVRQRKREIQSRFLAHGEERRIQSFDYKRFVPVMAEAMVPDCMHSSASASHHVLRRQGFARLIHDPLASHEPVVQT